MECYREKKNKEVLGISRYNCWSVSDMKINKNIATVLNKLTDWEVGTNKYIHTKITVQCDKHSNQVYTWYLTAR